MALPQKWKLHREGFDEGTHVFREVNGSTKILGRKDGVGITCVSEFVSRAHCEISYEKGVFYVTDLKSLNGTFLNGVTIDPNHRRELRDGDVIGVGLAEAEDAKGADYYIFTFRKWAQASPLKVKPAANQDPPVIDLTSPEEELIKISSESDSEDSDHSDDSHTTDGESQTPVNSARTTPLSSPVKKLPVAPPAPILRPASSIQKPGPASTKSENKRRLLLEQELAARKKKEEAEEEVKTKLERERLQEEDRKRADEAEEVEKKRLRDKEKEAKKKRQQREEDDKKRKLRELEEENRRLLLEKEALLKQTEARKKKEEADELKNKLEQKRRQEEDRRRVEAEEVEKKRLRDKEKEAKKKRQQREEDDKKRKLREVEEESRRRLLLEEEAEFKQNEARKKEKEADMKRKLERKNRQEEDRRRVKEAEEQVRINMQERVSLLLKDPNLYCPVIALNRVDRKWPQQNEASKAMIPQRSNTVELPLNDKASIKPSFQSTKSTSTKPVQREGEVYVKNTHSKLSKPQKRTLVFSDSDSDSQSEHKNLRKKKKADAAQTPSSSPLPDRSPKPSPTPLSSPLRDRSSTLSPTPYRSVSPSLSPSPPPPSVEIRRPPPVILQGIRQGLSVVKTTDDSRLNQARERIQNNQVQPRSTMVLDALPAARKPSRGWQAPPPPSLLDRNLSMEAPSKALPTRKEKLAKLALDQKLRKVNLPENKKQSAFAPPRPPVAKVTPQNRQDKLFESFASTTAVTAEPKQPPPPTLSSTYQMPLSSIMREMDKNLPPASVTTSKPSSSATRTKAVVLPSTCREVPRVWPTDIQSSSKIVCKKPGEDRVYRDILLYWKPEWLQDEAWKTPPVHGNLELITNLPHYGDFTSYLETFHPLMLHELWATIHQDIKGTRKSNQRTNRYTGSCEFEVGIEQIVESYKCPLLPSEGTKKLPGKDVPFWHIVHLQSFTDDRNSFNGGLDFGKFSYDVNIDNVIVKKEVFFFAVPSSDVYEDIKENTVVHNGLFQENNKKKLKYCTQIVTHLRHKNDIVLENKCKVEKLTYLHSKIREFKAFSQLPDSDLFKLLLNPMFPDPKDVYDPNKNVPPAELIRHVHTTLNTLQKGIVHHISSRILSIRGPDVMLLHGPPGTGKTRTIVGLVLQLLLSSKTKKLRILICTPSNTALDELIRRMDKSFGDIKMVRVGTGQCSSDVKKYTLDELMKVHCNRTAKSENISEAIGTINIKIRSLDQDIINMPGKANEQMRATKMFAIKDLNKKKELHVADLKKIQNSAKNLEVSKKQILSEANVIFSTLNSCNGPIKRELTALNNWPWKVLGQKCVNAFTQYQTWDLVMLLFQEFENSGLPLFDCCIVDEATQTTEPESLSPLSLRCEKLVLVGDPKQLPATVLSNEADRRLFGQSLFTRLFNYFDSRKTDKLKSPVMLLRQQYRMHPNILRWPNMRFYENKLETHNSVNSDQTRKLSIHPYVFLNIKGQESRNVSRQISNGNEVTLIKEILSVLQNQQSINKNHENLTIGIISPYYEQKVKLRQLLEQFKKNDTDAKFAETIEIDTVDSFQGREKDIILLSCVRTDDIGFLNSPERLNVALTRARMSLIIIGDAECLNKNDMWKSLMNDAVTNSAFQCIPDDYRDKGANYLRQVLEQRLIMGSPSTANSSK